MPPFILRFAPYLIGFALLVGGVGYYGHTRYNAGQASVRAEIVKALASQAERNAIISKTAVQGYKDEIDSLRSPPSVPSRPVRLCSRQSGLPDTSPAPGTDVPATASGELQGGIGPDIGPRLYSEAERADSLAAQLRALQNWVNENRGTEP